MSYFKTSLSLVLTLGVLLLSEPVQSNGSIGQVTEKNGATSGSTDKQQKIKSEIPTTQTQHGEPSTNESIAPIVNPALPIHLPTAPTGMNWGSVPDWGLLATAIVTAILALRSLNIIRIQANAGTDAANAALATAKSLITSERAYVKMSHVEPGVVFEENPTVRWCEVTVRVENGGRTPAKVTDARLTAWVRDWEEPLPPFPDIREQSDDSVPNAFLLPGDSFHVTRRFPLGKIDSPNPRTGDVRLCIFGFIDYIDAFEQRHRAGYAREFRDERGNNLFFVDRPGYNYDRQRQSGEGNDWN